MLSWFSASVVCETDLYLDGGRESALYSSVNHNYAECRYIFSYFTRENGIILAIVHWHSWALRSTFTSVIYVKIIYS